VICSGVRVAAAPGGLFGAGVGETWVASKSGGRKARNSDDLENPPYEVSLRGDSGKPTHWRDLGKADEVGEETGICTLQPGGIDGSSIPGKTCRDNVGKNQFPAGVRSNLQRPPEMSVDTGIPDEGAGLAHELVGARKKG
jgi:hypothetical protein